MQRTLRIALLELTTGWMPEYGNKPQVGYRGNALEKVLTAANVLQPDILIGPEYLFFHGGEAYTAEEKDEIIRKMAENLWREDMLVIPGTFVWQKDGKLFNSAPIIIDGKVVGEYFKIHQWIEDYLANVNSCQFQPGEEQGKIIPWNGMNIGLEICLDHEKGILKSRQQPVDIHIVTSSGMTLEKVDDKDAGDIESIAARDNGYAVLCDGWHRQNRVALQKGGSLKDMRFARYCDARLYEIGIETGEIDDKHLKLPF